MEHTGLLDIKHITAGYRTKGDILQDVSLHVHPGEIVCLIGESGCGKSTLLSAILQLPGGPQVTAGEIVFQGENLLHMGQGALRKLRGAAIGMVFQEPGASLNPVRKIGAQYYEAVRAHRRVTRAQAMEEAQTLFARLGLEEAQRVLEGYPLALSGGMNQRVAIALAMALQPALLLTDEPTSALDATVQKQIVGELLHLRDVFGTAIILSTHNIGVVKHMADKVAVMYCGRIVEYGYRESVIQAPAHPYTRALMAAAPKLGGALPTAIPGRRSMADFSAPGCAFAARCPFATGACHAPEIPRIDIQQEHWIRCRMRTA